jgi:hypothetical protein
MSFQLLSFGFSGLAFISDCELLGLATRPVGNNNAAVLYIRLPYEDVPVNFTQVTTSGWPAFTAIEYTGLIH